MLLLLLLPKTNPDAATSADTITKTLQENMLLFSKFGSPFGSHRSISLSLSPLVNACECIYMCVLSTCALMRVFGCSADNVFLTVPHPIRRIHETVVVAVPPTRHVRESTVVPIH